MSGYTYATTPIAKGTDIRAIPLTGREEALGIAGNTVFFSQAPEEDLKEADGSMYLLRCALPVDGSSLPANFIVAHIIFTGRRRVRSTCTLASTYTSSSPAPFLREVLRMRTDTTYYVRAFAGVVDVTIDGVTRSIVPSDGEVTVPRYAVHAYRVPTGVHGEFGERANNHPICKMRFLRRVLTKGGQEAELRPIQAMRMFYEDGACVVSKCEPLEE
jgi:hypothetical protein